MKRYATPGESPPRPPPRIPRQPDRATPPGDAAALRALSAATDRYIRISGKRPQRRQPSFLLAAIAAIGVGAALTLVGRFEYECTATMRISVVASEARLAEYRKELLDHLWDRVATMSDSGVEPRGWSVDSPGADLLRISLVTSDRRAGVSRAREIAEGYRDRMQAISARNRATPTEAETILSGYLAELQQRLSDARAQVDAAIDTLPDSDPSEHRDSLVARWHALRSDFDRAREQLAEASAGLDRLRQQPESPLGLVAAEDRRQRMEADDTLQQDLHELAANLTELKLHLLNVWQQTAGPLEQLAIAAGDLIEVASGQDQRGESQTGSAAAASLADAAREYKDALGAFAKPWNTEFTLLQRVQVDPLSGEVLDAHQSIRRSLNDFLFDAARRLSAMRSRVQAVGADPTDTARHHVYQSNLTRAFQTVQATHHRFEFASGAIETPGNFRLDAAIKSARGLRRRSQDHIRTIEEELQAEAAKRARKRREEDLAQARQFVSRVRTATDKTVDELIALQEELNLGAEASEAFLRAVLRAEVATSRLELARTDLGDIENRLHHLTARRLSSEDAADVQIVSCAAASRPVNLNEHLRTGGTAAALTLLTVLLGQWWITRRN